MPKETTDRETLIQALDTIRDALEAGWLVHWELEVTRPEEPVPTDGPYAKFAPGPFTRYTLQVELKS